MPDFDTDYIGSDPGATEPTRSRRGPSILLLLSALAALVVSGWALIGPFSLEFLGNLNIGWALVAAAVGIGAVLVLLPGRRGR